MHTEQNTNSQQRQTLCRPLWRVLARIERLLCDRPCWGPNTMRGQRHSTLTAIGPANECLLNNKQLGFRVRNFYSTWYPHRKCSQPCRYEQKWICQHGQYVPEHMLWTENKHGQTDADGQTNKDATDSVRMIYVYMAMIGIICGIQCVRPSIMTMMMLMIMAMMRGGWGWGTSNVDVDSWQTEPDTSASIDGYTYTMITMNVRFRLDQTVRDGIPYWRVYYCGVCVCSAMASNSIDDSRRHCGAALASRYTRWPLNYRNNTNARRPYNTRAYPKWIC